MAEDWIENRPAVILMVCTGNVCRSPVAERLLTKWLEADGGYSVMSAGTQALDGQPGCEYMSEIMEQRGMSGLDNAARRLSGSLIESADLILGMERQHVQDIVALAPRALRRTATLTQFSRWLAPADFDSDSDAEPQFGGARTELGDLVRRTLEQRGRPRLGANDPREDDIPDPVGRDREFHRRCFDRIESSVDLLGAWLRPVTSP